MRNQILLSAIFVAMLVVGVRISAAEDASVDKQFVTKMIANNQSAVDLAKSAVHNGKDDNVRAFAKAIVESREKEIILLQTWLSTHGK